MLNRSIIRPLIPLAWLLSLSACGGTPVCATGSLQRPNLNAPADFSVVPSLLPQLSWTYPDGTCHPEGYRIDLSPDRDFADTSLSGGTGNPSTAWFPGTNLDPGTEYFWKVSAINGTTLGPVSTYRRFFTGPVCDPAALAAPSLVWPADGETVNTLEPGLEWTNGNAGCIPQGYGIRLSSDPTFATDSRGGGTGNPDTLWFPGDDLADCTTYHWYVFSGIDTTFGPPSATRSFTTNASGACAPAGTGSISGLVFHDLCALPDGPLDSAPPGCVELGPGGGYGANGSYDPGEPGIPGVTVRLGQGICPASVVVQSAVTGPDGSYSFTGLAAGTYCVSADALDPVNVPVLIPGGWTHPLRDVQPEVQAVILGDGEARTGILFGWDYQFLPAYVAPATPTPTPAASPFFAPQIKPNQFYYRGTSCGPLQTHLQVQVADPGKTAGVWLFVRLRNQDGEETTAWTEALMMAPLGGGWYGYDLSAAAIPGFASFENAYLQYQFVAYDSDFNKVATSDVYWDATLSACHSNTTNK